MWVIGNQTQTNEYTDFKAIESKLAEIFEQHGDITSVFVTNSRVFSVARFLEKRGMNDILLIGYDFIEENIQYLKNGRINFLICQKPEEQGYRGVMALYHHLILKLPIANIDYMPIDIITKENYEFYRNWIPAGRERWLHRVYVVSAP